jgi:hypothetical protein
MRVDSCPKAVAYPLQAAIPQTSVRITEVNTGFTRVINTNDAGDYTFPLIDPSVYRGTGGAPGTQERHSRQGRTLCQ